MATNLRANLSENHKYYIDKHRYYELKHFCLQYPEWKRRYADLDGYGESRLGGFGRTEKSTISYTSKIAEKRLLYFERIQLIEQTAIAADPDLYRYILLGVTEELSYTQLKTQLNIPCGKDMYYDRYRKFFWLLDKSRN